ncbi:tryptophan 2,3-dioxygenase family protein [Kitasatospora sp. NPDC048365]|uniref:tryptophan 2,3-dioxygenase family protein n=1 Tax=Kitasatospora sp. NPDC048365 TaxID=3364050 RepID=UPI003717B986
MITTAPERLAYGGYLDLPRLLGGPATARTPAHDEALFIAVHRVNELWFEQLLYDLSDARDRMLLGETRIPAQRLRRCLAVQRMLQEATALLDSMTPGEFAAFRGALGTASGAQSAQFHELELLAARTDPGRVARFGWLTDAERARLARRLAEPTLWEGFLGVLDLSGLDVSDAAARQRALAGLPGDTVRTDVLDLAEALRDYEHAWALWRFRHALVAERQIGAQPGTAGSAGVSYLRARADDRLFPELAHLTVR